MNLPSSKNWKIVTAEDFCIKVADGTHDSPKQSAEGKFLVTSKNIKNGILDISSSYKISEEDFYNINKRSKVDQWDVLFSMIGTVGEVCVIKEEPDFAIKNVGLFKCGDKTKALFLYYFLLSNRGKEIALSLHNGTTQKYITLGELRTFKITVPEFDEEQKEVANILGSLDDKIELLRKENKTLENIAQTLFKEWLVDFNFPGSAGKMIDSELGEIPEGWRIGKLVDLNAEITDYVANGSFASLKENVTLYDTKNYALFIRNTDLKSSFQQKVYVDERSYKFLKKTQLFGGEIIISNVGDVGSVFLCPFFDFPMVLGNNTISLKSKNQAFFYTLFTNRIGQFLINSITGGSAQPKFNKTDFRNLRMIIPSNFVLGLFEDVVWPVYKKILKNDTEIQTLSKLRDELLNNIFSV